MKTKDLIEILSKLPSDTEVCVFADNDYWQVNTVRTVHVLDDDFRKDNCAVLDEIPNGSVILSAYEKRTNIP